MLFKEVTKKQLIDFIDEVSNLKGSHRELDIRIAKAFLDRGNSIGGWGTPNAPTFTSNVDSVRAIIPSGYSWGVVQIGNGLHAAACKKIEFGGDTSWFYPKDYHPLPAVALLLAVLRMFLEELEENGPVAQSA